MTKVYSSRIDILQTLGVEHIRVAQAFLEDLAKAPFPHPVASISHSADTSAGQCLIDVLVAERCVSCVNDADVFNQGLYVNVRIGYLAAPPKAVLTVTGGSLEDCAEWLIERLNVLL